MKFKRYCVWRTWLQKYELMYAFLTAEADNMWFSTDPYFS